LNDVGGKASPRLGLLRAADRYRLRMLVSLYTWVIVREPLINCLSEMKRKAHGAQKPRYNG